MQESTVKTELPLDLVNMIIPELPGCRNRKH